MALTPTQVLQTVQTYNESYLASLLNQNCFLSSLNHKFKDVLTEGPKNLGDTVKYSLPYDMTTSVGLVATFQGVEQRYQTLTCDQAFNTSYSLNNQDWLFNLGKDEYMKEIGNAAVKSIGSTVEQVAAKMANSSVPVMSIVNNQSVPTGALHTEQGPTRFYAGAEIVLTAFTTYQQLRQAIVNYSETGRPEGHIKCYLPGRVVPNLIGTALGQFVPRRNDEIAQSWELGDWGSPNVTFYESNMLPTQTAGVVGDQSSASDRILTVVSTDDATGANITQINCTCTAASYSQSKAVRAGDVFQFAATAGYPKHVTFYGKVPTTRPVQFRATADASSDGSGNITINVAPILKSTPGKNQNMTTNIVAGQTFYAYASHTAGLITFGDAYFMAMPQLPDESPYTTSHVVDKDTGASARIYTGSAFGQNQRGIVHDMLAGFSLAPEYSMRLMFPL